MVSGLNNKKVNKKEPNSNRNPRIKKKDCLNVFDPSVIFTLNNLNELFLISFWNMHD